MPSRTSNSATRCRSRTICSKRSSISWKASSSGGRHRSRSDVTRTLAARLAIVALIVAAPSVSGQQSREAAARSPIEAFFTAFNARDNDALKKTLHYPHVRINESGTVNVWRDASEAGTNFDGLTRSEGWARSSLDSVTMRQNDP